MAPVIGNIIRKELKVKTHTVLTPSNIEIEYRLAGAGSRLAAFIIDFIIQITIGLIITVIILFGVYDYNLSFLYHIEGAALGVLIISWFLVYFCYFIICEMVSNGRSPGKKMFGLRVISENGQPVGLSQSLIRNLFRAVLDIMYIGLFFILFSPKHKRIGDIVANTVVVAEYYEPMPLRRELPTLPHAGIEQLKHLVLTDEERDLLQIYHARKMYLPDAAHKSLHLEWAHFFATKWDIDVNLIDENLLTGLLQLNDANY